MKVTGIKFIKQIIEDYPDESFLKADGFDEALLGVETTSNRLIYSVSKVIEILKRDMTEAEAVDYAEFNIFDAWVGEQTPIWCRD